MKSLLVVAGDRALTRFVAETLLGRKLDRGGPTLKGGGWTIARAHSGLEGLMLLTRGEQRFDALLVDQSLPDREMLAFLDQVRKSAEGKHIPLYVMSERGRDQLTRKLASEAYAVSGFIDKPVTAESVRRGLRTLERMRVVLLVEPSSSTADTLAAELRQSSFVVETAATAKAAVQAVSEHRPDAVVISLDLKDMPGAELCVHLKRSAATSSVPVFLYGEVDQLNAVDIVENAHRADDFLRAPLGGVDLVERIRSHVGHSTATSLPPAPPGAPGRPGSQGSDDLDRSSLPSATLPLTSTLGSTGRGPPMVPLSGKGTVADTTLPLLPQRAPDGAPPRHEWDGVLNSTQRDLSAVKGDGVRTMGLFGGSGTPLEAQSSLLEEPRPESWLASPTSPPASASPASDRSSAKRTQRRVPCNLSVSFRDGETIYRSTTLNISNGGILIATEHPLEIGTHIDLTLELPTRPAPILARGKVAWIQQAPPGSASGVGIKFSKIDAQDLRAIVDYVNRVSRAVYVAP